MIQMGTMLKVADNSGAQLAICIKVKNKKGVAQVGDLVKLSVRKVIPSSTKVKKGEVVEGVIVFTKYPNKRKDGTSVKFDTNYVVLLNPQGEPIGTRVLLPVSRELRKNYSKLISLAPEVL